MLGLRKTARDYNIGAYIGSNPFCSPGASTP